MMPDVDGVEALDKLRMIPDCADLPVIFLTTHNMFHEKSVLIRLDTIGIIAKPYDPAEVCDHIHNMWKNRHDRCNDRL